MAGGYRAEWHPGESAPFLGTTTFREEVLKERAPPEPSTRRPLPVLWRDAAKQAGVSPEALRQGGRTRRVVEARDRFIQRAVWEAGIRASAVAAFLGCHPSNITRALHKRVQAE